jgi:hypothetical protein
VDWARHADVQLTLGVGVLESSPTTH